MKGLGVAIRGGIAGIKGLIAFGRRVAPSLVGGFNKVKNAAQSVWGFISGLPGKISGLAGRFVNAGKNIAGAIGRGIKSALQSGAGMAGDIGRAVADWLNAHTPLGDKISLPGPLPDFTLPALAAGGTITAPGSVLVGERGPEILSLPAGASVAPLGARRRPLTSTSTAASSPPPSPPTPPTARPAADEPPAGWIRLQCPDPAFDRTMLLAPDAPKLTGGVGGWETTARPQQVSMTTWSGTDPFELEVQVMLDGWTAHKTREPASRSR
jgi:hypothetical protein